MGKNIYQKKDIVKGVKHELQNAQLIFSTDMTKLNINQVLYTHIHPPTHTHTHPPTNVSKESAKNCKGELIYAI
jgi:hypothetical protein